MNPSKTLRKHFDGEEGSFLLIARCELRWDWQSFKELTSAMFDVAESSRNKATIDTWVAHGFWFCDTWIREWTSHPNFPRPDQNEYDEAIELIHDLSYFLFIGESPYEDDTLNKKSKG